MVFRRALAWALASRAETLKVSSGDLGKLLDGDECGEENGDQRGLPWLDCPKEDHVKLPPGFLLFEENLLRRPLPIPPNPQNIRRGSEDKLKLSPSSFPSQRALSVLDETASIDLLLPTRVAVVWSSKVCPPTGTSLRERARHTTSPAYSRRRVNLCCRTWLGTPVATPMRTRSPRNIWTLWAVAIESPHDMKTGPARPS